MATILPDMPTMLAFIAAVVVITLTPGPDMLLFLSRTMNAGRRAGLAAMAGAFTGLSVHTLLAAFGLSALLAASPTAFLAVKVAGALYLAWLAWTTLRHGILPDIALEVQSRRRSLAATWATGLAINLLNPKIVVFFITFLPQFVSHTAAAPVAQFLALGGIFILVALPISVAIILFADQAFALLRRSRTLKRAINWSFATLMGGFAVKLLLARAA